MMRVCKIKDTCGFLMAFFKVVAGGCSVIKPVQESGNTAIRYPLLMNALSTRIKVPDDY